MPPNARADKDNSRFRRPAAPASLPPGTYDFVFAMWSRGLIVFIARALTPIVRQRKCPAPPVSRLFPSGAFPSDQPVGQNNQARRLPGHLPKQQAGRL